MAVTIRRFQERDLPSIFPLYAKVFGEPDMERFKHRWRWQFLDNPACRPDGLWGWVAEQDNKILAYIGSYAARLKVGENEIAINVEADLIADPDARRSDPTMVIRLLKAVIDAPDHPLANAFATYTEPHEKLRKWLNHDALHIMPTCMRPYKMTAKLNKLAKTGRLPGPFASRPCVRLTAAASNLALKAINRISAPAHDPGLAVRRIDHPGDEFDELWHRLREHFPVISVRDRAFVQWRFFDDPAFQNATFGAYRDGTLVGYCAVQASEVRGLQHGRVLDLFCAPDAPMTASSLLRAGLQYLENCNVDLASCSGLHPALRKVVRRSFYFSPERSNIPSLVRWTGNPELSNIIQSEQNWHLSYADDGYMEP